MLLITRLDIVHPGGTAAIQLSTGTDQRITDRLTKPMNGEVPLRHAVALPDQRQRRCSEAGHVIHGTSPRGSIACASTDRPPAVAVFAARNQAMT